MPSLIVGLLVAASVLGLSTSVSAKVVAANDARFGPGSITVDLNTGHHWLDVTLSQGRTIADVSTQFGVGGDFEGFRYATRDEVVALFQSAGLTGAFGSSETAAFQALVGVTETGGGFPRTVARVSTQQSPDAYYAPDVTPGSANPDNCCASATEQNSNGGSWLVRTVVAADDTHFGPGSITVDLATGNEWLDLTLSTNRSIADVSAQLGAGGEFEGFRFASQGEVITFIQNAGLSIGVNFPEAPYKVLLGLVGVTQDSPGSPRSVGRVLTEQSPGQFYAPDVGVTGGLGGFANPNNCCASVDNANVNGAAWLVRNPAQPAPPAIVSSPPTITTQANASFSFTHTESGATFFCQLDGSVFSACASPKVYSGLTQSAHTFAVQALSASGYLSAPSTHTWTVDGTAPSAPALTSTPTDPSNQTAASFGFTHTETDVTFVCQLDGGAFTSCTSPATYAGLSAAAHTFSVKAKDGAGNESGPTTFTWTIDTTPPAGPTITAKPPALTNQTGASFSFSGAQAGVTLLCDLDGRGPAACTSPKVYAGLGDGAHVFTVQARDAAGNLSASANHSWTIDATPPPVPSIDGGPANPTNNATAVFSFSSSEAGVTFLCRLDTAAFTACTSPKTYTVGAATHTFSVKTQDAATNQSSVATRTWTVDTVKPPVPTIASKPANPTNQTTAVFTFTDTEAGVTFLCQLDGGAATPCTSPSTYPGLGAGTHVFTIRAQDAAGNQSAATSFTWVVDLTPPPTPLITQATVTASTTTRGATFNFTSSQTGVTFLCALDSGGFATCTPGKGYSGLAPGSHTFSLKARDAAGNESAPTSFTWTPAP